MIRATAEEDLRAESDLGAAVGPVGSGRIRYGAAMHLNRAGLMSDAALEVYRICSLLDAEDPAALLRARGLQGELPVSVPLSPDLAIRCLVEEAGRYLAGLEGPGVAEARSGLARWLAGPVTVGMASSPVVARWLPEALSALTQTHADLARAIGEAAPHLNWIAYDLYPAEAVGEAFLHNHAYASIIGESGAALPAEDWDMGLFLIAPHVLYRDHCHPAPELYLPLTGPHGWRFGVGRPLVLRPAHRPVWNDPQAPHLTKVGAVPFLSLFVWTRDVAEPATILPAPDWAALEALRLGV
jgi:Dimethlysulfonioproprionate lyase